LLRRIDRAISDLSKFYESIYDVDDICKASRPFVTTLLESIRRFSGIGSLDPHILDYRKEPGNLVELFGIVKFYALSRLKNLDDKSEFGNVILSHWYHMYIKCTYPLTRPNPTEIAPSFWHCLKKCCNKAQVEEFAARFMRIILGYAKDHLGDDKNTIFNTAKTFFLGNDKADIAEVYCKKSIEFISSDACVDIALLNFAGALKPAIDVFINLFMELMIEPISAAGFLNDVPIKLLEEFEKRGEFKIEKTRDRLLDVIFSLVEAIVVRYARPPADRRFLEALVKHYNDHPQMQQIVFNSILHQIQDNTTANFSALSTSLFQKLAVANTSVPCSRKLTLKYLTYLCENLFDTSSNRVVSEVGPIIDLPVLRIARLTLTGLTEESARSVTEPLDVSLRAVSKAVRNKSTALDAFISGMFLLSLRPEGYFVLDVSPEVTEEATAAWLGVIERLLRENVFAQVVLSRGHRDGRDATSALISCVG